MDIPWLERQGIRWASAPGCNADAAAQYTLALMVLASQRLNFRLSSRVVGIVGHGNVGSRVHRMLKAYGVRRIRVCDPPLADAGHPGLCTMEALTDCDVVSFHVPLTRCGPYPTLGLAGEPFLSRLPAGALLVNTSRGKVTEKGALQSWLASGRGSAALDVWPDEPEVDTALLEATAVATPHVAGYSLDGKLLGTQMVYLQFCDWLQAIPVRRNLLADLGVAAELGNHGLTVDAAILAACPVKRDDAEMRKLATLGENERRTRFDELRRDYPERRDFCGWKAPGDTPRELSGILKALGFG
jgi:erythronate-4-phosphate dehydrogenase